VSLKNWFSKTHPKGDWVRVGTDGKIKGDCAREPGEGKPKCMPRQKAHSMSKKDRATSAMRKRRKDPQVDRPGTGNKPINVKTDVKEKCWDGWRQQGMKKKGKKLVPNCVKEDKPTGKATKPYSSHGIPKDATKAELKAIRSNPNSSKGKKQLAHWKLNMHKEAVDNKDKKGLEKLVKGLKGSSKAHLKQMKDLKKMISDEYIEEKSVPNNPKLWAAKKAQAKAKFDVYPSAYANGWAAKQYKAAGGTWRTASESVEEGITTALTLGKAVGPALAKAAAAKAAPYAAGAAAAYGAGKLAKHKLKKRRDQKMVNKAADQAVAKYKAQQDKEMQDYHNDMNQGLDNRYNSIKKEGAFKDIATKKAEDERLKKQKQKPHQSYGKGGKNDPRGMGAVLAMGEGKDGITNKEKYMMTGRHLFDPKMGLQLEAPGDKGLSGSNTSKMDQLFRFGLARKDERQLMLRALKRQDKALNDPLLRRKLYELLRKMMVIVTDDQQIYRQFRQHLQNNRPEVDDIDEAAAHIINKSFEMLNIEEDMSGMSVSSGHKRSVDSGAGMTKKGVAAYRRRNPGSKLQTAVTTPPSKLKKGSKAAKRRKAFCSRSKSWTGERGKAARRRWNC